MISYSILAAGLLWAPKALAGFDPGSSDNIAIYWGQNSAGVSNTGQSQKSLGDYCKNTDVDIIPIAFLSSLDPVTLDMTNMDSDKNIGQEISQCQAAGKTILLSIGGATFTTGPSSPEQAQQLADQVWSMYGPGNGDNRPFGEAVVDGFDLDIEAPLQNIAPFAARLRENMDKANSGGSKQKFYLSAAPQCPFPDQNNQAMLQGDSAIAFDFLMVQFYNNPKCDVRTFDASSSSSASKRDSNGFNMDQWDQWAHSSKNPNVKVFLGIPGGPTAVTSSQKESYQTPDKLAPILAYSKKFSSFGGVMVWDMSQVFANEGFLDKVASGLKGSPAANAKTVVSRNASAPRINGTVISPKPRAHQRDWNL
ncbi:glycoside hydrolase family 18 protein [Hypoxylon sp. FL0543]|nr:glycoside hydrolase family 18 protein [Hypoxylon sp. FL0543]